VDDPTTLGLNLTYAGTLGVALIMLLCLGVLAMVTLVLAGIARLVFLLLLALVGIFPKKDTVPIVRLPATAQQAAEEWPRWDTSEHGAADQPEDTTADSSAAGAYGEYEFPASEWDTAPSLRDRLDARLRAGMNRFAAALKATGSSVKKSASGLWASGNELRKRPLPTAAELKSWASVHTRNAYETQAKHHPLLVSAHKVPPTLSPKWAAAVEAADRRAAERAKAAELPEVKVTVRDVPASEVHASEVPTSEVPAAKKNDTDSAAAPTEQGKQGEKAPGSLGSVKPGRAARQ
jgi:hypothetical protein